MFVREVRRAEGGISPDADLARSARNVVVDEHSVPLREPFHAVAHPSDPSHRLVAEDPGGPVVSPELLEVGPADPARGEAYGDLPRARGRFRPLFERDGAGVPEPAVLHGRARAARIEASRISIASSISSRRMISGGM